MRSGCSLPSTVLLLLLLGLGTWGLRHWQPSFICNTPILGWVCDGTRDVTRQTPTTNPAQPSVKKPVVGGAVKGVAHAFPWPVAEKPTKWTNFRKGAYSIPSVAKPAAVIVAATGVAHAFPWPVAEKPIKWSNFRKGAYSKPSVAKPVAATGVAHGFAWPIAGASIIWSNYRPGAYSIPSVAQKKPVAVVANATGVAHPFPWPVADKPVKWNNVRKAPKKKKIVAKKSKSKTEAHPFPWPVADKPRKWTNIRPQPLATGVAHPFAWPVADKPRKWTNIRPRPLATGVAHPFAWPVASAPRKWSNFKRTPKAVTPPRKASDCGAELNRVAKSGVILFETASATLKRSSYATLDQLASVAKTCDRVSITVEGHTDDRGSASFNQRLSEQRAQSVAAYLKGAGVAGDSLRAVGYGESRPAVPNTTAANLAKNRRIEFSVSGT